jgi:hypothetical protein
METSNILESSNRMEPARLPPNDPRTPIEFITNYC